MDYRIGGRLRMAGLLAIGLLAAAPAYALQCVPYAREASGIELRGDAWRWWNAAAGVYERGHAPRIGAVMVFRKFGKMRRGHVAVVARVLDSRQVLVDHANWGHGTVATMVAVRDVSRANDWSQVQVWSTAIRDFGTHNYPTYGFIYPRGESPIVKGAKSGPSNEAPDFILSLLATMPEPSLDEQPMAEPAVFAAPADDVIAELHAFTPAADTLDEAPFAAAVPLPGPAPTAIAAQVPASRAGAAGIWEGDRAAALRARSGQY